MLIWIKRSEVFISIILFTLAQLAHTCLLLITYILNRLLPKTIIKMFSGARYQSPCPVFILLLSTQGIQATHESCQQLIIRSCVLTLLVGGFLCWGLWSLASWSVFSFLIWGIALRRTLKAHESTTLLNEFSLCRSLTCFWVVLFFLLTKTLSDMFCPKINFASPAALFVAFFELREPPGEKRKWVDRNCEWSRKAKNSEKRTMLHHLGVEMYCKK